MNTSYLMHVYARVLLALGSFFSCRPPARAAAPLALALALTLGAGLLVGGTSGYAQDAAAAPVTSAAVNINSADAAALAAALNGIGQSRAAAIVHYRETYGPFSTVEELTEVKGISKKTLDKNRALITLE